MLINKRNLRAGITVILLFCSLLVSQESKKSFSKIVLQQYTNYPEMKVRDFYKLAHQAAMGNGHLGADSLKFLNYLLREMDEVDTIGGEPLLETISQDGNIIRVNLRPFKRANLNYSSLLNAMILTSNNFLPNKGMLRYHLRIIQNLIERKKIKLSRTEYVLFVKEMERKGYPAVHHSEVYSKTYHPAYRVIDIRYFKEKKDE